MTTKEKLIAELNSLGIFCQNEADDLNDGTTSVAAVYDIRQKIDAIEQLNDQLEEGEAA